MKNKILIGTGVVVVLLIGSLALLRGSTQKTLGAQVQNDQFLFTNTPIAVNTQGGVLYTQGGMVQGGAETITIAASTTVTRTLTLADVTSNFITFNVGIGSPTTTTVTLPGTSTLGTFIPNVGDRQTLEIYAASSTGGTITIAGGTGTTLQSATSTLVIPASGIGRLTFTRVTAGSILAGLSIQN